MMMCGLVVLQALRKNTVSNFPKMTENDMQKAIGSYRDFQKRYEVMIPCCFTSFDNEADLFCIRKSGLYDEIEIKTSRADFKNDAKKKVKIKKPESEATNRRSLYETYSKLDATAKGHMANYFWYAVPENLIDITEIPEYAGLIYVGANKRINVVREAKRLHKTNLTFEERFKQTRKLGYRFWASFLK